MKTKTPKTTKAGKKLSEKLVELQSEKLAQKNAFENEVKKGAKLAEALSGAKHSEEASLFETGRAKKSAKAEARIESSKQLAKSASKSFGGKRLGEAAGEVAAADEVKASGLRAANGGLRVSKAAASRAANATNATNGAANGASGRVSASGLVGGESAGNGLFGGEGFGGLSKRVVVAAAALSAVGSVASAGNFTTECQVNTKNTSNINITCEGKNISGDVVGNNFSDSKQSNNLVVINNSNVTASGAGWNSTSFAGNLTGDGSVYGGVALNLTTATVQNNIVNITGSSNISGSVYGGYSLNKSQNADSKNGQVNIIGESDTKRVVIGGSVYGGYGQKKADSNNVTIKFANISKNVFGGYTNHEIVEHGNAYNTNNIVRINNSYVGGIISGGFRITNLNNSNITGGIKHNIVSVNNSNLSINATKLASLNYTVGNNTVEYGIYGGVTGGFTSGAGQVGNNTVTIENTKINATKAANDTIAQFHITGGFAHQNQQPLENNSLVMKNATINLSSSSDKDENVKYGIVSGGYIGDFDNAGQVVKNNSVVISGSTIDMNDSLNGSVALGEFISRINNSTLFITLNGIAPNGLNISNEEELNFFLNNNPTFANDILFGSVLNKTYILNKSGKIINVTPNDNFTTLGNKFVGSTAGDARAEVVGGLRKTAQQSKTPLTSQIRLSSQTRSAVLAGRGLWLRRFTTQATKLSFWVTPT